MKLTYQLNKDNVNMFYETGIIDVEICIPFVGEHLLKHPINTDESEFNRSMPQKVKLEVSTKHPKKKGWVKVEYTENSDILEFCSP